MMNQQPKISIITPSFNQGSYLRQCIDSVLGQGYPHLEYIIIDGGSTDQSRGIIEEYADRLTYWHSRPDGGQSDGINQGFARASGELVAWLNADDFYLPGALARVAEAWKGSPGRPFYFGDGLRVDEAGKKLSGFFPKGQVLFSRVALVMGLNYILQPSTFMSRSALERAGSLDTALHYGMDSDLWLRLSALGEPATISAALSASREYASTKTSTGGFARAEELRRIAERHAGAPTTPGAVCYWLDTLHRLVREGGDLFPASYARDIETFWASTSALFARFGARPDGFPLQSDKARA